MPTVKFIEVGRGKISWTVELKNVDEGSLIRELIKKKILMSRSIHIEAGKIIVGGFREVGRVVVP